jgi:hypothetical protein
MLKKDTIWETTGAGIRQKSDSPIDAGFEMTQPYLLATALLSLSLSLARARVGVLVSPATSIIL